MRTPATLVAAALGAALLAGCAPNGSQADLTSGAAGTSPSQDSTDSPAQTSTSGSSATEGSSAATTSEHALIDQFPLTSGWPAGLAPPQRTAITLPTCDGTDAPFPDTGASEGLAAQWKREARSRQLLTYEDEQSAAAAAEQLLSTYRECPTQGRAPRTDVTPRGSVWRVVQTDQTPNPRTIVLRIVPVGRSLLVDRADVNSTAPKAVRALVADQRTWAAGVVAAMEESFGDEN